MPKGKIIMKYLVRCFKLIAFTVVLTGFQLLIGCSTLDAAKEKVEESLETEVRYDPDTYEVLNKPDGVKGSDMPEVIAIKNLGKTREDSDNSIVGYTGVVANFNTTATLNIMVKAPAKQEFSWVVPPSEWYYIKVGPGDYYFSIDNGKHWTKVVVDGENNLVCGQWVGFQIIKGNIPKDFMFPSF